MLTQRFMAKLLIVLLMIVTTSAGASTPAPTEIKNLDLAVKATTGVNPNDYPCAKAGIINLFQKREEISGLSSWHPKRIFTWMLDMTVYYARAVANFFQNLMSPGALDASIRRIHAMATSGDPLGAATNSLDNAVRKMDGWVAGLGKRTQSVLTGKVHGIINNTTNEDGSCKK